MSNQFKPGDLAMTLCAKKAYPAMCVVELIHFVIGGRKYGILGGQAWIAPCDGWVVDRAEYAEHDFYEPHQLMPLLGDLRHEQVLSREHGL